MLLRIPSLGGPEAIHHLSTTVAGSDSIGIWQEDPVYGWNHQPGSRGHHRLDPDFDVHYSIDLDGHRRTGPPSDKPKIVALGGSFTFGYGVDDVQTYSALLERSLGDYDVINAGAMAWGTTHAWLKLQDILATDTEVRLVLYGFIHLPDGSIPQQPDPLQPALDLISDRGAVVDLCIRLDTKTIRFAGNNHPSPGGHQLIAAELLPIVQDQLQASHR